MCFLIELLDFTSKFSIAEKLKTGTKGQILIRIAAHYLICLCSAQLESKSILGVGYCTDLNLKRFISNLALFSSNSLFCFFFTGRTNSKESYSKIIHSSYSTTVLVLSCKKICFAREMCYVQHCLISFLCLYHSH